MDDVDLTPIRSFIGVARWQFAKSMPQIPHWYTLRKWHKPERFEAFVRAINEHGEVRLWHGRPFTYLDVDGFSYWHMGEPVEVTEVINRAVVGSNP